MTRTSEIPRLLLVDDDPEILLLWRMVLGLHGGFDDITEAQDGEEALRLLAMTQPDVVVTDYSMTGISGFEVIDAVRRVCPHAVIVMSSSDPSVGPEALRRGASSFMTKLSSVSEELAAEVHALLRCDESLSRPSMPAA